MGSKTMKQLNMTTKAGFDYGGIPPGIQKRGLFCLYRLERKTPDAVKPEKVPYKQDGTRVDPSNPANFCSFDEALAAYHNGGFDGIGIGCFAPIGMTDVDGCVHDGKLDEWAQKIVDELDSYTELSPSGTGIHIFFLVEDFTYDKERYYINNRKTHVEVYVPGATHRFLTMTGQCIHGTEVMERTEQLKGVLEKYMVRPQADVTLPKVTAPGSYLSDCSVIAKMQTSKQGEKAKALWEGNIPDGKSHSEADMALAEILAFWCGGDIEQMDRLFRQSGLMRDKWDRPQSGSTYGWLTLEKAVRNCTAFYSPVLPPAEADFNDVLEKLTELEPLNSPRYRSGDIGYGRLFANVFKDIARYVPERKKWFVYDGKRWAADIAGLMVMELAKDMADAANRTKNPANVPGVSYMTGKVRCELCGLNYNKQKRKVSGVGDVIFWKCRGTLNGGDCKAEQITEEHLNQILADALGVAEITEEIFTEMVYHIGMCDPGELIIYLRDGSHIRKEYDLLPMEKRQKPYKPRKRKEKTICQ